MEKKCFCCLEWEYACLGIVKILSEYVSLLVVFGVDEKITFYSCKLNSM